MARYPAASLVDVKGTLYGTTEAGGVRMLVSAADTVFSISTTGIEKTVLCTARSWPLRRGSPVAGLINVDGTLYGTTPSGGALRYGGTRLQHHDERRR